MVTHNRKKFIGLAIDSILSQTFQDWELIIVDDASVDGTEEMLLEYIKKDKRIRYIKNNKNLGISKSRNLALENSRGKYLAVLDSDDVWNDITKLSAQVRFLEVQSNCVLVGCGVIEVIDADGNVGDTIHQPIMDSDLRNVFLYKNPFTHSSVMYRRAIVEEVGGYGNYAVGEDYELLLHMGIKGSIHNLPGISVQYRKHSSNISLQKRAEALKLNVKIINKYRLDYPKYILSFMRRYLRFVIGSILLR